MTELVLLRPDKAGDLIKTLPALRALIQSSPGTPIHLIVSKANESLLKFEPHISFSTLPGDWAELSEEALKSEIETLLKGKEFLTAVNLLSDSFPEAERLLHVFPAQEKFSIFSDSLPTNIWPISFKRRTPAGRSETLNIAEILSQALGLDLISLTDTMDRAPLLGKEDFDEVQSVLGNKSGPWIAICPFAGTQQRTHALNKWKFLIRRILKSARFEKVIVFGAPSDTTVLNEIKTELGSPSSLMIVSPSSFRALGAFLKICDRVVAVDSGPLHMSLALGVPSLGFLSGGDRSRWFSQISTKDKIIGRGLLDRYPSALEMFWHFSRWK